MLVEWSSILPRLKSRIARGSYDHPAFMGNCPTISHTFSVLSTQWMNLLKGKEDMGSVQDFILLFLCLV